MTDEVVADPSTSPLTEPALVTPATSQLGAVFLTARKAKSLTQQDVSSVLRLSIKQIEALETDNFAALPEAMITRGFIRNYARLLEIDAEPLLDSYRSQVPDRSPSALSVQSSMHQVVSNKQESSWTKYIAASVLVLLCLLVWLFYMNSTPKSAQSVAQITPDAAPSVASTDMVLPELALPAAERQAEANTSTDAINAGATVESIVQDSSDVTRNQALVAADTTHKNAQSTAVDFNALKANAVRVSGQLTTAQSTSPPVASTQAPSQVQVVPAGVNVAKSDTALKIDTKLNAQPNLKMLVPASKKVSISVSERSWVSITNKSGKVVFEKMLPAGSEDSFDAEPPLNVLIGNAQATKLMLSGKAVDLTSATKNNVTHITLE